MDSNETAGCRSAQQAPEHRSAIFETFFQNAPVAMLLLDEGRTVCEMNHAAKVTFAVDGQEPEGLRFGSAVHCLHVLDAPGGGCGLADDCEGCTARRVVADTFETGRT